MEEMKKCTWCEEELEETELVETNIGLLCEYCIAEIKSRGEEITIY